MLPWLLGVGLALLVVSSLAVPARAHPPRPSQRRIAWLKAIAALRAVLVATLALVTFAAVHAAVAALSDAARWIITLAVGAGVLAVVLNAAAALWLLSRFVGADLGLEVIAANQRGILSGYGWACLEVTTDAGWTSHLPYAAVAMRPFSVCRHDGPRLVELTLRRPRWREDDLQYLRQVAVLSPFRDPSLPVSVSHRARVATVRLGLAQRATHDAALRHLERALARRA
ncbi:MAG TPA: hypothetical protein VMG12_38695 [Polyangiaceae bacterium]|nr:hypothetical protein [Polyangiaceae bacterium]